MNQRRAASAGGRRGSDCWRRDMVRTLSALHLKPLTLRKQAAAHACELAGVPPADIRQHQLRLLRPQLLQSVPRCPCLGVPLCCLTRPPAYRWVMSKMQLPSTLVAHSLHLARLCA